MENGLAIEIFVKDINGLTNPIGQVQNNGGNVSGFQVSNIISHGASLWNVMYYEEGKNKFSLDRPLYFPNGVKIQFKTTSVPTTSINVALRMYGVETI